MVGGISSAASDFLTIPRTSLAAARVNGGCTVYDTAQGKIIYQQVFGTSLVPQDGKKLVVNNIRGFLVYTLPDLTKPQSIPSEDDFLEMRASKDGALLAGLTPYSQWKGLSFYTTRDLPNQAWDRFDFSPDGRLAAR